MLFLSYHLFLPFVQMCSDAGTGYEPDYESTHKERPQKQLVIWERKQPANQGVPQLLIEISACKPTKSPMFYYKFLGITLCTKINHSLLFKLTFIEMGNISNFQYVQLQKVTLKGYRITVCKY